MLRKNLNALSAALAATVALSGCSSGAVSQPSSGALLPAMASAAATSPITHVVIIFQENRTPDFLFQGIPGADIATSGIDSRGNKVPLKGISLAVPWDIRHNNAAFVIDWDGGKMDGFDKDMPLANRLRAFAHGLESEMKPYHDMALQYVLADHMFGTNQGPSFPAHLYIISGTASDSSIAPYKVLNNPRQVKQGGLGVMQPDAGQQVGGCDSPSNTIVDTIKPSDGSLGPQPFPCFDPPVLSDFLNAKGVSWRYYQQGMGAGLWRAYDAIRHVRYGSDYANVITPPQTILNDISGGRLAGVSWVMPASAWSDHAGPQSSAQGPAWVAAIVNAIGQSKYWKNTAIFVTWDDWGGFYDHVPPPIYNHIELGIRVPLLVISPYAKTAYVSKERHEFGSILAFTEETFGIPKGALNATDRRSDDLMDAFDFSQKPRTFKRIQAPPFNPKVVIGPNVEDP